MGWRNKDNKGAVFRAPPGYRDSGRPIFNNGEVISSTYQIKSLLHGNDTGQVYEAWDMLLERPVALKGSWRDEDVPPLLTEARAACAIADPCVADIYGLGHHHGTEYLVAERITGPTLAQRIERVYSADEQVPPVEALEMLTALARGLAAVHDAGYAARRLSTGNVLVTGTGRLVLSRFALGQGTLDAPPVLAPEIITGAAASSGGHDPVAVDLYALGCIATELCTGQPPFSGDTLKALEFAHVHQRPGALDQVRGDLPVELGDLVGELLGKKPEDRPPNARDVLHQLRAIGERASASRPRVQVLIVDDDPQRVRPLWSVLRRAHSATAVDAVVGADEAGYKLQTDCPDVLIVNLDLPGAMNGLEMCMYFRGLEASQNCTIVAMGYNIRDDDAAVLEQIGVTHILPYHRRSYYDLTRLVRQLARGSSGA